MRRNHAFANAELADLRVYGNGESSQDKPRVFGREDEVVSDTVPLPRLWGGLSVVSGLGPGLTR
jgi:hypothetical protein